MHVPIKKNKKKPKMHVIFVKSITKDYCRPRKVYKDANVHSRITSNIHVNGEGVEISRRKWASALFVQKNQRFAPFLKLIREIPSYVTQFSQNRVSI